MENQDLILRIDLSKLEAVWSPFRFVIWSGLDSPITREEIQEAIAKNQFLAPPRTKCNFELSRKEQISRIAWLVFNYDSENFPIDIDFGVTNLLEKIFVQDGNHRLAAALYRNEKFIHVNCSGGLDRIQSFEYKVPMKRKILMAVPNFFLWLFYFSITTQERMEYNMSLNRGYKCVGSEDTSLFLPGSARTFQYDRNLPPTRDYMTWKEFWAKRY